MATAFCIALFALGHLVRDGWPSLGTTHGARAAGMALCCFGVSFVHPDFAAALIGVGVWIGFYTDQKHGEGQQARGWADAGYLALSGVTSVLPLAVFVAAFDLLPAKFGNSGISGPYFEVLPLVGLAKPPIWFLAWFVRPDRWWPWAEPTRASAILFGAVFGAALCAL
jgi:hypothetical protein